MKKTILITITILVVAAAVFVYLKQTGRWPGPSQPGQNNSGNQNGTSSSLTTYKNDQYNFEISYPPQYVFSEGNSPQYNVGEFFVGVGTNIATIRLPDNSYPGTNYFDAFITISVSSAGVSETSCRQSQEEGNTQITDLANPVTINNVTFWRGQTNGAAAGTFAQDRIYHAYVVDKCYEATLNLFEGNIGNYPAGSVSQIDDNEVFSKLEAVLDTLKITVPPPAQTQQDQLTPEQFVANYLEAYKNIATKKNFAQVKSFLSADALAFMQEEGVPLETNYTKFDSYQILSIKDLGNHFAAQVKLSQGGQAVKNSQGSDTIEIDFIRQGVNFKSETWYFTQ